jgi:DNA-binding NarL/FixJ family response regulator
MKTTINIAVVEDQALFRECFVANIRKFNHLNIIAEAGNGRQLLDMIAAAPVKPDIVLTDLSMPEMNGLEVTKRLRTAYPDMKIIVLSVLGDEKYVSSMVQQGVNGYLAKNAEMDEVCRAIESVYEKGFFFNDTMMKGLQSDTGVKKLKANRFNLTDHLTRRELEVLDLICREHTTHEIAEKLFLSVRTVEGHRNNLLEKTGARNTAGLVIFALRNELVSVGI